MTLLSRAPTRIDLAGGTLDIWPLYLLVPEAATVNVAIDLYAEAALELSRNQWRVTDSDARRETEALSPGELDMLPGTEIVTALLRFFAPREPLVVQTRSQVPPRSGLGASSALGIATAGALNDVTGRRYNQEVLIEIVKNIEARVLGTMTGSQDHFPPVYGGACCLWWGPEGVRREPLPLDADAFEKRFLLAYTNQPHRSGANNWEVIKRFLDGDRVTQEAIGQIGQVAVRMRNALSAGDLNAVAALLKDEWEARRQLAPEVLSPELDRVLDAAVSSGADAGKACGAGGGGCLLLAVRPESRSSVEEGIRRAGGRTIPFHLTTRGLRLEGSP